MIKSLMVGLLVLFWVCNAKAQLPHAVQSQYRFKYLTVDDGLSNNNIRAICQDAKGFIWIATKNGINKFDGRSVVSYRNEPYNNNSISANAVNKILLDSKDNLWVATESGLDIYSSELDCFNRFNHEKIKKPIREVYDLAEDKEGKLWIAAQSGLYAYNLNTYELIYFSNRLDNPYRIPTNSIFRLLVDKNNNIWISILNEGLGVYDQYEQTFRFYRNKPDEPNSIVGSRIETIYEDAQGNIWAGTYNSGLNKYIPRTNSFINIIPDKNNNYSTRVRAIFEDLKGNFFIGTRSGLYVLDSQTNSFIPYAHTGHYFSKLSQNSITTSFIDPTGTLWIGTFSGGINYTNLNKKEFIHYKADNGDNHFLLGTNIYAITEDEKGNIWVGGDNGLNYLDRKTNKFKYYLNNQSNPSSLSYNDIKSLEWDKKGNLWIGTNKGGLNCLNVKTGRFKSYMHDPDIPNTISGNKIYGLLCDRNNDIWILTNTNIDDQHSSIDILRNGSDKVIHLNEKGFFGLEEDEDGNIYIGGIHGFWIFSRADSIFSFISNEPLIGKTNSILLDSRKGIWIGSNKGLVKYNRKTKSFLSFSEDNGYPISEVFGILEDDNENLWVSTNLGLVKISNIVEGVDNIKFRVFDSEDGLQSKQFNYNSFSKFKTGEMAFGGINGFNTFFPNEIIENSIPPKIIITDLKIFNTSVNIGEIVDGRLILEKSISVTNKIVLSHKQNTFTLEFAALHYANPEQNIFKYKLQGFDKKWQYRKAENNFATYTNLSAGEYTFLLTGANNDGVWNPQVIKLEINILSPWWNTTWFKVLLFLTILSLIGLTILVLILRERNKMALVIERMKINKLNELNMLKLKSFTNISHEIRTSLTLILTPLEKLISNKAQTKDVDSYLEIIYRNTKNLNSLINQLLDFRKLESGSLKLELMLGDLVRFLSGIVSTYNNLAVEKGITLKFSSSHKKLIAQYDADKIEKIMNNLLSNAFKFTKNNGKVSVNLSLIYDSTYTEVEDDNIEKEYIEISVRDTGEGIAEKNISKIFDRFYKSEFKKDYTGTGIGLSFVKELVKIQNGKIFVESKPGKGSKFIFRIPFIKDNIESVNDQNDIKDEVYTEGESEQISHDGKIMLVIDDNPDVRILIRDHFRDEFKVFLAKDGKEGWEKALKIIPDVIISDIMMNDMNGFEFCKKVKNDERTSHIPILLLTALNSKENLKKGLASGANDYITKPFDLSILQTKIQNILSIRDSFRKKYSSEIILQPKNVLISSHDQKFLQNAIRVVEANIAVPEFDLERFVQEVGVSRMQLYRKLHALTDMTVKEFVRDIRLKRAAQLLKQDSLTISEIAYEVGFKDASHFGKCFRQAYGLNPKEYRKRSQNETE